MVAGAGREKPSPKRIWVVSMSMAVEEEQGEPCTATSPEVTRVKEPQDLTELCGK